MSKAVRGLGKGLGELFGAGSGTGLPQEVPIAKLTASPWQPRQRFNQAALGELAKTVAVRGILQPILVRSAGAGKYEIVAGERRWRAAKLAKLRTVPIILREFSDRDAMLTAIVENLQREDLHVLEQAQAARRIINELSLTVGDAAEALGMSRPGLSNLLRLLDLDPPTRQLLANNAISTGHARALAAVPSEQRAAIARRISHNGLNVRQTEQLVKQAKARPKPRRVRQIDPDSALLAEELSQKLGMRVQIRPGRNGNGQVVIAYHSLDSLDKLLKHLRK